MFCTSFVNKKYAGASINILLASVSSSLINRPIECTNRPNVIPDPVHSVAHASSEGQKVEATKMLNSTPYHPPPMMPKSSSHLIV